MVWNNIFLIIFRGIAEIFGFPKGKAEFILFIELKGKWQSMFFGKILQKQMSSAGTPLQ